MRVLITDTDLGDGSVEREILEAIDGIVVETADCLTEEDLLEAVQRLDPIALIVQWAPVTRRVLQAATNLRAVSRYGIGLDNVDLQAARDLGVSVRNVPHYCVEEVATHALALGLNAWRRVREQDIEVRQGLWQARVWAPSIKRLSEARVGLVGMGRIPSRVAPIYAALGAEVVFADPYVDESPYTRVSLEELLATSDLISLHAPLVPETQGMLNSSAFASMLRRPHIVNTSRGGLIDYQALIAALDEGRVATASLDVFDVEPLPAASPLRTRPTVTLTPHASWCSSTSLVELQREAALNIVRDLELVGRR